MGVMKLSVCLLLVSLGALPPAQAQSRTKPYTLTVDVNLVNVFVNVTDKNGALVGGLTKENFAVTEDGRPQEIAVFERQTQLPLNIALAIDTSGSVQKDMAVEKAAALEFAKTVLRPQDRMAVYDFATEVRELTAYTNKLNVIKRGLGALKRGDATALYDAISLASEGLARYDGRKVLILISDGGDTGKNTTYEQALAAAERGEVMIYSLIDVPIEASAGRDIGGEHALITLAEETGGKSYYIHQTGMKDAFAKISDDLRTQYLLGYYPRNQVPGIGFHRIRVSIPHAAEGAFIIRNRTGYFAQPVTKE